MVGASEGVAARAASFSEAMRGLRERCELRTASLPTARELILSCSPFLFPFSIYIFLLINQFL